MILSGNMKLALALVTVSALLRLICWATIILLRKSSKRRHLSHYTEIDDKVRKAFLNSRLNRPEERAAAGIYGHWFMLASGFVPLSWGIRLVFSQNPLWPLSADMRFPVSLVIATLLGSLLAWTLAHISIASIVPPLPSAGLGKATTVWQRCRRQIQNLFQYFGSKKSLINGFGSLSLLTLLYLVLSTLASSGSGSSP
jgi:hypothetical protein